MSIEAHNDCIQLLKQKRSMQIQLEDYKRKMELKRTDPSNAEVLFYKVGELDKDFEQIQDALHDCNHEYLMKICFLSENMDFED